MSQTLHDYTYFIIAAYAITFITITLIAAWLMVEAYILKRKLSKLNKDQYNMRTIDSGDL